MAKVVKKARGNGNVIISNIEGAIGTIPTVADHTVEGWLDTDLYEGEALINVHSPNEMMKYERVADNIYFTPISLFNLSISRQFPYNIDRNLTNVDIEVTFNKIVQEVIGVTVDGCLTINNFELINPTTARINVDSGDSSCTGLFSIIVDGETLHFPVGVFIPKK